MTTASEVNGTRVALDRAAILAAQDLAPVAIEVPEWKGTVYVRGMTAKEAEDNARATLAARAEGDEIPPLMMVRAVAACCCDAKGAPLFTIADVESFAKKSAPAISRVFRAIERLSGVTVDDAKN
jgi:hypothetical protein